MLLYKKALYVLADDVSCDQFWYKYSVLCADKLWMSNADGAQNLLNTVSADNIDWIFRLDEKTLVVGKG